MKPEALFGEADSGVQRSFIGEDKAVVVMGKGKPTQASLEAYGKLRKSREERFEANIEKLRQQLDEALAEREDVGMASEALAGELDFINDWLKQNKRLAKLTELIPKAKKAEGELAYITKGQFRKYWGKEPSDAILTSDGKRVRWEYALDVLAGELGLAERYGESESEAVRDMIVIASEYKNRKKEVEHILDIRNYEYKESKGVLEKITEKIGRSEQVADVQAVRTKRAKAIDDSLQAEKVLQIPMVVPWLERPNRYDIRGVDTRRYRTRQRSGIRESAKMPGIFRMRDR